MIFIYHFLFVYSKIIYHNIILKSVVLPFVIYIFYIFSPVIEFEWNTTEWSGCSKSCGGGERTREASCLRLEIPVTARYLADINNTRITGVVNDSMCVMFTKAGARPTEREVCNREQCPIWRAGAFSQVCEGDAD